MKMQVLIQKIDTTECYNILEQDQEEGVVQNET